MFSNYKHHITAPIRQTYTFCIFTTIILELTGNFEGIES